VCGFLVAKRGDSKRREISRFHLLIPRRKTGGKLRAQNGLEGEGDAAKTRSPGNRCWARWGRGAKEGGN